MDYNALALELHRKYKGKITTSLRDSGELTREKLSAYYSPGVGEISRVVADDPAKLPEYTWTNNLVAVISDGSAVLGLGDIGPEGAMPVMEGKALLFKHFADIDCVPIVLDVHSADDIVRAVKAIYKSFGAINLEDIAAPVCFEVEERLKEELPIPLMHDDQHGTAIVTLAGLINAMKVTGRKLQDAKIVIVGAGAAGVAIARLIDTYAQPANMIAVDSKGIISPARSDLNQAKQLLLQFTNRADRAGSMADAIREADIFIGVSQANLLTPDMVRTMAKNPIIFALANPVPEILPGAAKAAGAAVVATGRSDFPNQVNNALAFPGIFRGALDHGVKRITDQHKMASAETIAGLVAVPTADEIIPSVFHPDLVKRISSVIV